MAPPGVRSSVLILAVLAGAAARRAPIAFTDRAAAAGLAFRTTYGARETSTYILETTGTGVALFDYDGDGRLDVFFANGTTLAGFPAGQAPRCALFRNDGDGTFTDMTERSGIARSGWGQGVAAGDYDNDGRTDLYLTFFGKNVLLRNKGDGTFADVTGTAGVAAGGWSTSAAFADYDNDGRLDLYVARYVDFDLASAPRPGSQKNCFYRGFPVMCGPRGLAGARDVLFHNEGGGVFRDATERAGGLDREHYRGLGVVWGDYDDDGWPDLLVANDAHPNLLYHNERDGTFAEVAFAAGVAFDEDGRERAGMGVDFGDYDGDGRLDVVVTNFYGEPHSLYRNQGNGAFLETTWPSGVGEATMRYLGWGAAFADFDNDGARDLFFVNGHVYPEVDRHRLDETYAERSLVFRNQGDGTFADVTASAGEALASRRVGRGAAFGDYDDDGRVDAVVATVNDRAVLLHNEGGAGNHWLTVKLAGTRGNRDALGARVRLRAGTSTHVHEVHGGGSYLSQSDLRAHFGLGADATASVEVRWPGGATERVGDVAADQIVTIEEGRGIVARRRPRP